MVKMKGVMVSTTRQMAGAPQLASILGGVAKEKCDAVVKGDPTVKIASVKIASVEK